MPIVTVSNSLAAGVAVGGTDVGIAVGGFGVAVAVGGTCVVAGVMSAGMSVGDAVNPAVSTNGVGRMISVGWMFAEGAMVVEGVVSL
ncbi:MAG: hypothetical protein MUO77_19880 [Anaerolineales bacterium]|nr:hypothetical protein [Anaerolineales bacterium]